MQKSKRLHKWKSLADRLRDIPFVHLATLLRGQFKGLLDISDPRLKLRFEHLIVNEKHSLINELSSSELQAYVYGQPKYGEIDDGLN
jgi:hypothetical protein